MEPIAPPLRIHVWSLIVTTAGQPADDSDIALLLARMLAHQVSCDHEAGRAGKTYLFRLGPDRIDSHP